MTARDREPDSTDSDSDLKSQSEIKPSRLHPSSLVFELISHIRQLIVPIVIAVFSAARDSATGLAFAVVLFVSAVGFSMFRYFTLRYKIDNGELVVKQGLIFRRIRTVPVNRIQNIDLVQNVLHRLLRVAEVKVETASGEEAEAKLRVLSMQQIAKLRREIFEQADSPDAMRSSAASDDDSRSLLDDPADESVDSQSRSGAVTILRIPTLWLLKAGLASNRGLLIVGLFVGFYYQFEDYIDWIQIVGRFPVPDGSLLGTLQITGLVVGVFVLLRLFGIVWFLLRFSGYQLALHGEDLRISCGLLTKVSATIPRHRIQFISLHRPLVLRWFGLTSIRIETAGGGAGGYDNDSMTVSRRWFIPVVENDAVAQLMRYLRPGLDWQEQAIDWCPLAPRATARLVRIAVVQSFVIGGIGIAISQPWGFLAGIAVMPLLMLWAKKKSRAMRYARIDEKVIYCSGLINRKTSLTFFDKIQTVVVEQSPLDRRWKMATLFVDTAASGPAKHRIHIPYLDESFATREYNSINQLASRFEVDQVLH